MTAPLIDAVYLDGTLARRRPVGLRGDGDHLEIIEGGAVVARWALCAIRRVEAPGDMIRLTEGEGSPARLELAADAPGAALFAAAPYLRDRVGGLGATLRIVGWSAAAGVSLILSAIYLVPVVADRAAPLVPLRLEQRLGQAVEQQVKRIFGEETCTRPDGVAALHALTQKLARSGGLAIEPDVAVLDSPVPNAMALPGGKIYLLRGLLERAQNADEIAGVIGHEMGHVAHRDGLRALLRAGGTSFLLGLLFGDVTGAGAAIVIAQIAVNGISTREAERGADRFAKAALIGLGRSPKGLGTLLARIDRDGVTPAFLRSHPLTAERLAALGDLPDAPRGPLLSDEQWRALRAICGRS